MKISIAELKDTAPRRPDGYMEDVLSRGTVDGEFLILPRLEYLALCAKYRQLGDMVEVAAKPIAKAIDKVAGTNLRNCGGCRRRRYALNKSTKPNN